jgi:hypothetical protein
MDNDWILNLRKQTTDVTKDDWKNNKDIFYIDIETIANQNGDSFAKLNEMAHNSIYKDILRNAFEEKHSYNDMVESGNVVPIKGHVHTPMGLGVTPSYTVGVNLEQKYNTQFDLVSMEARKKELQDHVNLCDLSQELQDRISAEILGTIKKEDYTSWGDLTKKDDTPDFISCMDDDDIDNILDSIDDDDDINYIPPPFSEPIYKVGDYVMITTPGETYSGSSKSAKELGLTNWKDSGYFEKSEKCKIISIHENGWQFGVAGATKQLVMNSRGFKHV